MGMISLINHDSPVRENSEVVMKFTQICGLMSTPDETSSMVYEKKGLYSSVISSDTEI